MSNGQASAVQLRRLGGSDLQITPLGLGAWAIGGAGWSFGWGAQDDKTSVETIVHAVRSGINWIDTAAIYGFGHSEEIVAQALKKLRPSEAPYIFTKCSLLPQDDGSTRQSLDPQSLRQECEASLNRLGVNCIDLYQIHWPTDEIEEIDAAWSMLDRLRTEGKVRYIGVSNFNVEEMQRAQAIAPITSLQPPYSLIDRQIEGNELTYTHAHDIGVIVYSPMASGLLTGAMTRERSQELPHDDWRKRSAQFQEPKLSRNLELAALLGAIAERHGVSTGEVALAWTLANPAITGAIVGARSPAQVDGWIGGLTFRLSRLDLEEIELFQEIRAEAMRAG